MSRSSDDASRTLLVGYLDMQRRHILGIVEGLDDDAMRRAVLPSGWTCVELVQHLILDVERFWFEAVVAGDQGAIAALDEIEDAWVVAADVSPATVLDAYRAAIESANTIISRTPLDAAPAWWPGQLFGDWRMDSVDEVILHVMVETACHAGHLDAARELIDNRQWLVVRE